MQEDRTSWGDYARTLHRSKNLVHRVFRRSIDGQYSTPLFPRKRYLLPRIDPVDGKSKHTYTYEWHDNQKSEIDLVSHLHFDKMRNVRNIDNLFVYSLQIPEHLRRFQWTLKPFINQISFIVPLEHTDSVHANRLFCLLKSNHLVQYSINDGQLLQTTDKRDKILDLTQVRGKWSYKALTWNCMYTSFYTISPLLEKSYYEVTVFELDYFSDHDTFLKLKCKFHIDKSVFGQGMKTVILTENLIMIHYANHCYQVYDLNYLVQEYSTLITQRDANLFDFYDMKKEIPITLDIKQGVKSMYQFGPTEFGFLEFGGFPMFVITRQKEGSPLARKSRFEIKNMSAPWTNPIGTIDHISSDMFPEATQDCIFYDRHYRLLQRHAQFIQVHSVKDSKLTTLYKIHVKDLEKSGKHEEERSTRKLRQISRVDYSQFDTYDTTIQSTDYDDELDLLAILVSTGNIFIIRNIDGTVLHNIKCEHYESEWNNTICIYEDKIVHLSGNNAKQKARCVVYGLN
jgi:hypothetical protein